jgi:hypothetical protein
MPDTSKVAMDGSVIAGKLYIGHNVVRGDGWGALEVYDPSSDAWTTITPPADSSSWNAAVDPTDPSRIVAAEVSVQDGKVWRSTDAGSSWTQLDISTSAPSTPWLDETDVDQYMSPGRLVFDPAVPGRLWFAEGMGVWRADLADPKAKEVAWVLESDGIEELVATDLMVPPGGDPISAVADREGFHHVQLDRSPGAPLVGPTFAGGTDLDFSGGHPEALVWVGAEYQKYWQPDRRARGAYSLDGGVSWTELPNLVPDMFGGNVAISATDPANIVWLPSYFINPFEYGGKPKGIFVTKDRGAHWASLPPVDGSSRYHRLVWWWSRQALAADKVDGGVFYLVDDTERAQHGRGADVAASGERAAVQGGERLSRLRAAARCT